MNARDMGNQQENERGDPAALFEMTNFLSDKIALAAGAVIFLLVLSIGYLTLEWVYSEAATREVLAAIQSSALFFAGSLITAAITMIALMLTALSATGRLDTDFNRDMFLRLYRIVFYATVLLGGALILMLILCVPLRELSGVPDLWYQVYYHSLMGLIALVSGLLATTAVELHRTIRILIGKVMRLSLEN